MGFPYRTHINTHLMPMLVLYFLLAGFLSEAMVHVKKNDEQSNKMIPLAQIQGVKLMSNISQKFRHTPFLQIPLKKKWKKNQDK